MAEPFLGGFLMATILKQMESLLKTYVIVFSELLEVDVSILDSDLVRIAGTGIYKEKVGQCIATEAMILKRVINTGDKWIVDNPKEHEICQGCTNIENCQETFEMSTAIFWGDKVVGGIGFGCFSEKQRENLRGFVESFTSANDEQRLRQKIKE